MISKLKQLGLFFGAFTLLIGCGPGVRGKASTLFLVNASVTGLSGTLVLKNNGGDSLTVTANGIYSFSTSLLDGAPYSVTVDSSPTTQRCAVANGSGNISHLNVTIEVSCANKSWSFPSGLSSYINPGGTNSGLGNLSIAINAIGNTLLAFSQPGNAGGLHEVFLSSYSSDTWTHPENNADFISTGGRYGGGQRVAMNSNGEGVYVWQQYDNTTDCSGSPCYQIFMIENRNGTWTSVSGPGDYISLTGTTCDDPAVAIDSSGNTVIVWQQEDGANKRIYESEYRNGTWTHPSSTGDAIDPGGSDAYYPKVKMDNNGNSLITWEQNSRIYKSEYRGTSWSHPSGAADCISPLASSAGNPELAMDNNGNALITWRQNDGTSYQTFMSEYRSGSWTHPSGLSDNISPNGTASYGTYPAMGDNGDAIIVWKQNDGSNLQIYKSEYREGSWTHPTSASDHISISGSNAGDTQLWYQQLDVAMNSTGEALISWIQSDGSVQQVFKSEYSSGSWSHPSSLSDNISPDGKAAFVPAVALSNNGDRVIAWYQRDSSDDIQVYMAEFR